MEAEILNSKGEKTGKKVTLNDAVFGRKVNPEIIYRAVVAEHANKRPNTAFFKNRALVKMTTKKMYKQKGTGNARHGAASVNIFVGGGAAFGAQRHNYKKEIPARMRKSALLGLLSMMAGKKQLRILDSIKAPSGKTKEVVQNLKNVVHLEKSVLLIGRREDSSLRRAAANIHSLVFSDYRELNTLAFYRANEVVMDVATVEEMNKIKV
jgi:large subunit ribosomal protein L4